MESKKWYQSVVLWFNVVTILLGVLDVVSKTYYIPQEYIGMFMGIGNIILRILRPEVPLAFGGKIFGKKS
jgi:hypothetical protein